MNELGFDEMLGLIAQHLSIIPSGQAGYTLLLGAGFSYGVIPTASEIVTYAPQWLHQKREQGEPSDRSDVVTKFWQRVAEECKKRPTAPDIEFDPASNLPRSKSAAEAYKLLMSVHCPGGLTTPGLRRDFMRHLCLPAIRKNNPAHLFLACLLHQ